MLLSNSTYKRNWLLVTARKRLGMTQKEVAELVGVSASYYSQIEAGVVPGSEVRTRLSRLFGVGIVELFSFCSQAPLSKNGRLPDEERVVLRRRDNPHGNTTTDVHSRMLSEDISSALSSLEEEERKVLELRFGLDGTGQERELGEVASILDMDMDRAHQLMVGALMKLRRGEPANKLAGWLDE